MTPNDNQTNPNPSHPQPKVTNARTPRPEPVRYIDPVFELEPFPFGD